jgi:hypothetical protein
MEVNPSKCATASYMMDAQKRRTFLNQRFTLNRDLIPTLTTAESVRYLGAPISARRTVKLKTVNFKLREMEVLLEKIMASSLLTVQKIDAVKTFLLPSIDFLLLNGDAGIAELLKMDKKIRGKINYDMKIRMKINYEMRELWVKRFERSKVRNSLHNKIYGQDRRD